VARPGPRVGVVAPFDSFGDSIAQGSSVPNDGRAADYREVGRANSCVAGAGGVRILCQHPRRERLKASYYGIQPSLLSPPLNPGGRGLGAD